MSLLKVRRQPLISNICLYLDIALTPAASLSNKVITFLYLDLRFWIIYGLITVFSELKEALSKSKWSDFGVKMTELESIINQLKQAETQK